MIEDYVTITIPSTGRCNRLAECIQSVDYRNSIIEIGVKSLDDVPLSWAERISVSFTHDFPVPVQIRLAAFSRGFTHILPISDDIVFDPGAIKNAVSALNSAFPDGDGVIGFDIKNMKETDKCPYAFMLIGRKFFNDRLGRVLFNPEYRHFFADVELGEFAERLGRFRKCPEARITHFHPSTGAPADSTHTAGRHEKWVHDKEIYDRGKAKWQGNGSATLAECQRTIQTPA